MAYLALFVALGGSSYAALNLPRNSVKAKQIAPRAVQSSEAHNLTVRDFKRGERAKLRGDKGERGDKGDTGAPGPKGDMGATGPAGPGALCQGNDPGEAMVSAGSVCIDRYEVSVWSSPTGGTQYGASSDNYPCADNGQGCKAGTAGEIYARSVPGVTPSRFITYFQAQQALANSGKRLPTSAEWQQAVAGTPDSTACNVSTGDVQSTGANAGCISNHGANDMVGNLFEWVADWVPAHTACPGWGTFSDDWMCLSGASTTVTGPDALLRGGSFLFFGIGANAGPFAVFGDQPQDSSNGDIGFRGAR